MSETLRPDDYPTNENSRTQKEWLSRRINGDVRFQELSEATKYKTSHGNGILQLSIRSCLENAKATGVVEEEFDLEQYLNEGGEGYVSYIPGRNHNYGALGIVLGRTVDSDFVVETVIPFSEMRNSEQGKFIIAGCLIEASCEGDRTVTIPKEVLERPVFAHYESYKRDASSYISMQDSMCGLFREMGFTEDGSGNWIKPTE